MITYDIIFAQKLTREYDHFKHIFIDRMTTDVNLTEETYKDTIINFVNMTKIKNKDDFSDNIIYLLDKILQSKTIDEILPNILALKVLGYHFFVIERTDLTGKEEDLGDDLVVAPSLRTYFIDTNSKKLSKVSGLIQGVSLIINKTEDEKLPEISDVIYNFYQLLNISNNIKGIIEPIIEVEKYKVLKEKSLSSMYEYDKLLDVVKIFDHQILFIHGV